MSVNFNEDQKKAVTHTFGPALVLAGPGSGKTAVICGRLEYLITKAKVPPEKILVVTFSKKSAAEMKERFSQLCIRSDLKPLFGTFHSVFYSIIRSEGGRRLRVVSERQKYQALLKAAQDANADLEYSPAFFSSVADEISRVKGNALDINGYTPSCLSDALFRYMYKKYNLYLSANGLIDFDDMQLECLRLLSSDSDILKKWQERFPFILIDEFQDINLLQYEIMRLLAGRDPNIFAVGDDDQSIYGFRGARPALMKHFLKDYKNARRILLNVNYRSGPEIVSAAGKVICKNDDRFPKDIHAAKKKGSSDVKILSFPDAKAEADQIISRIRELEKTGVSLSDIAILFRNNADMEYIAKRLSAAGLCFIKKGSQNTKSHFISCDIFSYIRAAYEYPRCRAEDILLIMNRPPRCISRSAVSEGPDIFRSMKEFYRENKRMSYAVLKFEEDLKLIKTLPSFAAVKYIRNAAGYEDFLKESAKESNTDLSEYEKILGALEEKAGEFSSLGAWLEYIKESEGKNDSPGQGANTQCYLSSAGSDHSFRRQGADSSFKNDAVNILTIHASKGLEWEAVFIPMCTDGIIPGKNTDTLCSIEEERRILYVAMTRAKSLLQISLPETIRGKKTQPCRFIDISDIKITGGR